MACVCAAVCLSFVVVIGLDTLRRTPLGSFRPAGLHTTTPQEPHLTAQIGAGDGTKRGISNLPPFEPPLFLGPPPPPPEREVDFGQFQLRPISTSANCNLLDPHRVGPPNEAKNLEIVGSRRVEGPKISLFYFPSPAAKFVLSFPLWGSFTWNLGWCSTRRGPEMCTFGVLGLSCEAPATKPLGFHTTVGHDHQLPYTVPGKGRSDTCTPKFHEKSKERIMRRETEKHREILPFGPQTSSKLLPAFS